MRFGEHNILTLRKELHAAVDEEARFSDGSQKDIRKQLMDKVLMGKAQNHYKFNFLVQPIRSQI